MLPTDLLFEFLSAEPLPALARRRGLSFSQLLAWLDSPDIQHELASLDTLALRRAQLITACAHTTCTAALERLAVTNADPLESRRAATGALRAITPSRATHAPHGASERPRRPAVGKPASNPAAEPPRTQPRPAPSSTSAPRPKAPAETGVKPTTILPTPLNTLLNPLTDPLDALLARATPAAAILHANGRAPPSRR